MRGSFIGRSRWAAIGAAVAVSLGAGGIMWTNAASPESSVVTIDPVRIMDTRDPNDLGLPGPFVSATGQDLKVTGSIPTATGTMTVVPTGATGVFLNVTPVNSQADGFISVRPATATGAPTTSNVNFVAGAINPNGVLVELPVGGADDGTIEITFDAFGQTGPTSDILVDVFGYTTDARLRALETTVAGLQNSMSAYDSNDTEVALSTTVETLESVSLTAPATGKVIVNSSTTVQATGGGSIIGCTITTGATTEVPENKLVFVSGAAPETVASTRGFDVTNGQAFTANLVCASTGGGKHLNTSMTAIFTPA